MEDEVFNLIVISVTNYNILRHWLCIDGENLSRDIKQALNFFLHKVSRTAFSSIFLTERKEDSFQYILPDDDDNQHKICSYLDIWWLIQNYKPLILWGLFFSLISKIAMPEDIREIMSNSVFKTL